MREIYHTFDGAKWQWTPHLRVARRRTKANLETARAGRDPDWPDTVHRIGIYMASWRCRDPEEDGVKILGIRRMTAAEGIDYELAPTMDIINKMAGFSKVSFFQVVGAASFGILFGLICAGSYLALNGGTSAYADCMKAGGLPSPSLSDPDRDWVCRPAGFGKFPAVVPEKKPGVLI